ncbi:monofunctional biosynthetic peptidoglycan transglycosylase [Roseomonas sp. BN140053]|uniref:monofunctional biosynthetic peptidoglycan transglycosylase n=1 Tax=Roseomonas sp. BN140053 TaxID=3391898 RepID=UPI0039E86A29
MPHSATPAAAATPARRAPRRLWRRAAMLFLLGPLAVILAFRVLPVPATPLMLIRAVQGHGWQHDWVPYERIAPALARAVIASEDNRFCEEPLGFDTLALGEQIAAWWDGERPRGASTLTMQTAKNLLLWPGRDPVRKLLEAWLTPQIALLWPKRRVLEVYLNSVEFGPGLYGAEAAARAFFRKPAAELTAAEASQLAVVLPSPLTWSAARPTPYLRERAATIRHRVSTLGPLLDCAD